MTTITATTVLRSRHTSRPDCILSTLLLRYPRFIHAEFMTHRAFSRNAASSRAIPVRKLIRDIRDNPAVPLFWGKNQKGMQANEECQEKIILRGFLEDRRIDREDAWLEAMNAALDMAEAFSDAGYHKQVVNRLLEPFSHITVLVSATEWENFFELRDHPDAEPHIQMLAREIRREIEREDNIQDLRPGQWHLPFIDPFTDLNEEGPPNDAHPRIEEFLKISTACCASTSYKTVEGFEMSLDRAIAIHDKLLSSQPVHASPAEHVAMADAWSGLGHGWGDSSSHGNFLGFRQYRHLLSTEAA